MAGRCSRSSSKKRLTSSNGDKASSSNKNAAKKPQKRDTASCTRKISAILTRLLFALHSGIALWRVSFDYPKFYLYFLSIGLVCLLFEMVFTLACRQGREYKWFCPSVLFYLMSVVPCLWLLELARLDHAMDTAIQAGFCNNTLLATNGSAMRMPIDYTANASFPNRTRREVADTIPGALNINFNGEMSPLLRKRAKRATNETLPESIESNKKSGKRKRKNRKRDKKIVDNVEEAGSGQIIARSSNTFVPANTTISDIIKSSTHEDSTYISTVKYITTAIPVPATTTDGVGIDNIGTKIKDGFTNLEKETLNIINKSKEEVSEFVGRLSTLVDASTWVLLLHQVLLFVLVIGRWLLPKGEITRDQLSQLLLVFIGVGADILEFVTETIDSDGVDETNCGLTLHYVIYGVWSWSLLQFTLVLTASKSRKTRVGFDSNHVVATNGNGCCAKSLFSSADLWGILVTLFLQDVPFLATRLYILIVYNLQHQMMIFFTGKNVLVVILQIYRIIVLKLQRNKQIEDSVNDAEMQPLRGTLVQLARKANMVADADNTTVIPEDVREATFKQQRDGSVVVKIHLEGEETLKRKRKMAKT